MTKVDFDLKDLVGNFTWYLDDDGESHLVKVESYDEEDNTFIVELRDRRRVRVSPEELVLDDPADIPLF